ncbi:MAG: response regulator [Lachnospiraceae bacterium]|nr:response regulator [Lachnospiraceae bacterium]
MRRRSFSLIISGFVFIFVISIITFLGLNHYMEGETEDDVKAIASVYLHGIADEESNRFNAIKNIRFEQIDAMLTEAMGEGVKTEEEIYASIKRSAEFQDTSSCLLVAANGDMQLIEGEELTNFGSKDYIISTLVDGKKAVATGENNTEKLVLYCVPAHINMENGAVSVGLIWARSLDSFLEMMNLTSEDSLVFYHIIREDGSYVIANKDAIEGSYFNKLLLYSTPDDGTAQEYVDKLKECIANDEDFFMNSTYKEPSAGIDERRSVYATSLIDSNWYLVTVMPYGVLDSTISDMSEARNHGMLVALAIVATAIIIVFAIYMRMTHAQIEALEAAKTSAEEAMIESEASQEEAIKAREDAEYANKAKSEFLSNMSHDIRTPMNAIVGMTAIASDHINEPEKVEDCLRKISLSGKQLLGLINDVLDMSKIESGKLVMNMEALSLRETMETICDIIRPQLKSKHQHFDIFISNILAEEVYLDGIRINQVLLNFLSNAMKFTPDGGSISIRLNQEESPKGENFVRTNIFVSDNGIGMSKEFKEKIFEAFEREDNKRVHKIQGTGLGMAITKYIVDAMGGTIVVESEQGEGTTFKVILDLEKVDVSIDDMKLPDMKVLVCDDNEDLCMTATTSLDDLGVRSDWCTSGKEAIEKAVLASKSDDPYFAILIDYKMDEMDGIETTKKLREVLGDKLPISLISAYDWVDIEDKAKEVGVSGFVPKPLFKSTLYHELKKYLPGIEKDENETIYEEKRIELKGLNVLLAEDQFINAEIITTLLEERDANVELAEDGKIAVETFEASGEGHFDVILMDLRMPNMNGFEAAKAIRNMDRDDAKKVPIIALTADAFAEDAQKCLEAGMNTHMSKPVDVDALMKTLAKYMEE